jgi:hypothetical protein
VTQHLNSTDRAVLTTLSYADIFDFPLTPREILRYCVAKQTTEKSVRKSLSYLFGAHTGDQSFISLAGRKSTISKRRERGMASLQKWQEVSKIARWLRYIPSIKLVGVTGALAMNNAGCSDDIDLFIVAKQHTLWMTRMLTVFCVELFANRRHPDQKEVANSMCLNMFVTEDGLAIPKDERDLYTAHEALQMVPIWEGHDMYRRFLEANRWIQNYLPNWWKEKIRTKTKKEAQSMGNSVLSLGFLTPIVVLIYRVCEPIAKRIQIAYMEKRRTREVIGDSVVRFHPRDTRAFVYDELSKRLKALNIPLDNVFVLSIK